MNKYRSILRFWLAMMMGFFPCIKSLSQESTHIAVIDKFRDYSGKIFQEKLFLHTDREFYTAGEILWFKIYYVDGAFHKPADFSKVAYVEVLNEKNEPVLQTIVSLEPQKNNGSLYLPTSVNTGYYTIRAYTGWMKNFDAAYYFEKKVAIVNTLKTTATTNNKEAGSTATIQFFPEGGNLVSNIKSVVGFIVSDVNGGINNYQGFIVDQNNDTLLSFSPLKFGIGRFELEPIAGSNYKAVVTLSSGKTITSSFPTVYEKGYVMRVRENEKDQFVVSIRRKNVSSTDMNEQLLLAIHCRQVLKYAQKNTINNDSTVFIVDKRKIGQGVIHFTIFNGNDKPVCERLCFIKPTLQTSPKIKSDKEAYGNREKIDLDISIPGDHKYNLSASVFELDSLQVQDNANIVSYLWLGSDLPGIIESPGYYFSNDENTTVAIDNLMLTYGWRRFKWEDVLSGNENFIKYHPETKGHLVSAQVRDPGGNKSVANVVSFLSVSGHPFGFYSAVSNKEGFVQFEVKDFYGNRQLTAIPGNEADSFYKVDIIKPFALSPAGPKYSPLVLSEKNRELLLQKSISMQVQNIFSGDSIRSFAEPMFNDTLPFYGKGETRYNLDEYKRFTTMEEVLREYVAGINVAMRNGRRVIKMFDPGMRDFYTGNALVMIDGVALANPHNIFSYDPLKVRRLDVVLNRYIFGEASFSGIASFSTYNGTFDAFDLDPRLVAVDYTGLQLQREFYSPVYTTKEQLESRMPDLRNTLFWSPEINCKEGKASLQFYSSDRKGRYLVILQGISSNGEPVSVFTTFSVK